MLTFSSQEAANHVLSFGEYCALYLFFLSNVLWPDDLQTKDQLFPETGDFASAVSDLPLHLRELYPTNEKELEEKSETRDKLKENFDKEVNRVNVFRNAIPRVRRALANIPSYMIFDDHEITDDWFLTKDWQNRVLTSPSGVNIIRNGMLSYALFQAWGNDPQKFKDDPNHASLLSLAQQYIPSDSVGPAKVAAEQLDLLFGFDGNENPPIKWHFSVLSGPTRSVVLDTRTRRTFRRVGVGVPTAENG